MWESLSGHIPSLFSHAFKGLDLRFRAELHHQELQHAVQIKRCTRPLFLTGLACIIGLETIYILDKQ